MPPFPKPKNISFDIDEKTEIDAIKKYITQGDYQLPTPKQNQLLFGTWNIANFDTQKRPDQSYKIIAEIIRPFDLIAIQEVNANLEGLENLASLLEEFSYIITDIGGNNERMCYFYKDKAKLTPHIGELDIPPSSKNKIKIKFKNKNGTKTEQNFQGFDRNPYVASWKFQDTIFTTYNCHIYFGDEKEKDIQKFRRRILEIYAMVKWVGTKKSERLYSENLILLGDMNIPSMKKNDEVFRYLEKKNFEPLDYTDYLTPYSNIANTSTYDQLVVVRPFSEKITNIKHGILAWDNAVFSRLYEDLAKKNKKTAAGKFQGFAKWAISDHRPLWTLLEFS